MSSTPDCKAWIAQLPAGKPRLPHAQLVTYVQALPAAAIAPAAKLEALELLREPVADAQAASRSSRRQRRPCTSASCSG